MCRLQGFTRRTQGRFGTRHGRLQAGQAFLGDLQSLVTLGLGLQ